MGITKEHTPDFIAPNLLKHKIRSGLVDMYDSMLTTVGDAFIKEIRGKQNELNLKRRGIPYFMESNLTWLSSLKF